MNHRTVIGMFTSTLMASMIGCGIDAKTSPPPMGATERNMTEQDVSTAAGLARSWRRQSRVLLVWSDQETILVEQATRMGDEWAGWEERDLRLVLLSSRGAVEVDRFVDGGPVGPSFGPGVAAAVSDRFDLGAVDVGLNVALVGKDGGVKERWTQMVSASTIFDLVDSMPMRRREMSEDAD